MKTEEDSEASPMMSDHDLVRESEPFMRFLESVDPDVLKRLDAKARRELLRWANDRSDARIRVEDVQSPILRAYLVRSKAAAKRLLPYLRPHHH